MIWGKGPSHWVGGLRKLALKKKLYQVGDGRNRVGMTFMDDRVSAHIAAWRAVEADTAVGGQAFFINGGAPVVLWNWVRELAHAAGWPGIQGTVSKPVAAAGATVCDALSKISGGALYFPISRYLITELTTEHYSVIDRARAWLSAFLIPRTRIASPFSRTTLRIKLFDGLIFMRSVHHRNLGRGAG